MGVHFQIYCGCGAYPAADTVVSAARPCSDAMGRDMKSTRVLHARLATASLRAFDRDTGSFTLVVDPVDATRDVDPVDAGNPADSGQDAEPVTVAFLPSEYMSSRPAGLAEFETFLRSARTGTPLTFIGRWVTRSWLSRSGDLREVREFEATRMAEGYHDHGTLCGPWRDGPHSCPALAARQMLEATLPTARRTADAAPPCSRAAQAKPPAPEASHASPFAPAPSRLRSGLAAAFPARPGGRLLGIGPRPRITLTPPTPPAATLTPCAGADPGAQTPSCQTPGCCQPPNP